MLPFPDHGSRPWRRHCRRTLYLPLCTSWHSRDGCIKEGRRHAPHIARRYFDFRDELSTDNGLLLKGPCLVILNVLQEEYLTLHLNHLLASQLPNYDWLFGTLPFGLICSKLDTMDLETYPRTYSVHFWHMSLFDNSTAIWPFFRKWVLSENQSFVDEEAIVTPLSVYFLGG